MRGKIETGAPMNERRRRRGKYINGVGGGAGTDLRLTGEDFTARDGQRGEELSGRQLHTGDPTYENFGWAGPAGNFPYPPLTTSRGLQQRGEAVISETFIQGEKNPVVWRSKNMDVKPRNPCYSWGKKLYNCSFVSTCEDKIGSTGRFDCRKKTVQNITNAF